MPEQTVTTADTQRDRWNRVAATIAATTHLPAQVPHVLPQGQVRSGGTTAYYGLTYRTPKGLVEVRDLYSGGRNSRRLAYQAWREDADGIARHNGTAGTAAELAELVRVLSGVRP